jgi:hypothetical protein
LETSNLSWDEKLLPNKIMFVKYMTKSWHLSTPTAAHSTQHQLLENPSIKKHIDAPLLIHLNTLNYLSIWPSVVVWKHEKKCDCKWTNKEMRWCGMRL